MKGWGFSLSPCESSSLTSVKVENDGLWLLTKQFSTDSTNTTVSRLFSFCLFSTILYFTCNCGHKLHFQSENYSYLCHPLSYNVKKPFFLGLCVQTTISGCKTLLHIPIVCQQRITFLATCKRMFLVCYCLKLYLCCYFYNYAHPDHP